MKHWTLLAVIVAATGTVRADEAGDLLTRAIKASIDSEEALAKRRFCHWKQTGVIYLPNGAAVAQRDTWTDWPERVRWNAEMRTGSGPIQVVVVLNGLTGWAKTPMLRELSTKDYESARNEAYTLWLATLGGARARGIKWELAPDGRVDGRAVRVLKATAANRPTVTLSLDRDSFLVLKASYSGQEDLAAASKDFVFAEHREFGGVRWPAKVQVFQSGKKIEDWATESVRFPEKIDDREFARP